VVATPRAAADETTSDQAGFLPARKFQSLPGTVVGVLASDTRAVTARERQQGPADALGFSTGGGSYYWIYVPVKDKPQIGGLNISVGEKGQQKKRFDRLSLASLKTVKPWGVTEPYTLVEVEVNGGLGSPAGETFVGTQMRVLDGTKDYPLRIAEVLNRLRPGYQDWLRKQQGQIDAAMGMAQQKALGGRKPTGPRETAELLYVTWLPETAQLRVQFQTRVRDGVYRYRDEPVPAVAAKGPPLPRKDPVRFGTTFGVELGVVYEVSKAGTVLRGQALPIQSFQEEIPPPPPRRPPKRAAANGI
jgi:hypothetical protein